MNTTISFYFVMGFSCLVIVLVFLMAFLSFKETKKMLRDIESRGDELHKLKKENSTMRKLLKLD